MTIEELARRVAALEDRLDAAAEESIDRLVTARHGEPRPMKDQPEMEFNGLKTPHGYAREALDVALLQVGGVVTTELFWPGRLSSYITDREAAERESVEEIERLKQRAEKADGEVESLKAEVEEGETVPRLAWEHAVRVEAGLRADLAAAHARIEDLTRALVAHRGCSASTYGQTCIHGHGHQGPHHLSRVNDIIEWHAQVRAIADDWIEEQIARAKK